MQELLKAKGLKISGRKDELIARLAGVPVPQSGVDKCSGKICVVDKVCNPDTGRCVSNKGKIGKKISIKSSSPKKVEKISIKSSSPKKVQKIRKVKKVRKISEKNLKKLLIMEKAFENSNQEVPSTEKLTKMLLKWKQDVITLNLKNEILDFAGDNKYKKIYMFKRVVRKAFPIKTLDDGDLILAFLMIFATSLKRSLGKELFDMLDETFSVDKTPSPPKVKTKTLSHPPRLYLLKSSPRPHPLLKSNV